MTHAALRLLASSALLAGCAQGHADGVSAQRSAVVGGSPSGPEDDAVVRVVGRQPRPFGDVSCSGFLIAENLMVTALHCVAVYDNGGKFGCRRDGTLSPPDLGYGWIGAPLEPRNVEVIFGVEPHDEPDAYGAHVLGTGATQICTDDIAVVVLDRDLPISGLPVRLHAPVIPGELMTVIGYGWSNAEPEITRWRRSGVTVIDVGPDDTTDGTGTALPRSFVVGDGPCDGDSGGPAISDETSAVTGMFTLNLGGNCLERGTFHSFVKTAPYEPIIRRGFELAGKEPTLERATPEHAEAVRSSSCSVAHGHAPGHGTAACLAAVLACVVVRRRRAGAGRSTSASLPG